MKKICLCVAAMCLTMALYNAHLGDWAWAVWFTLLGGLNLYNAKKAR